MEAVDYLYKLKYQAPAVEAGTREAEARTKLYGAQTRALEEEEGNRIGIQMPDGTVYYATPKEYMAWHKGEQNSPIKSYQFYYDQTVAAGGTPKSFEQYQIDLAKAGAMNLGEYTARKEVDTNIRKWSDFTSPKYKADMDKRLSESVDFRMLKASVEKDSESQAKANKLASAMVRDDLIQTYGEQNVGWSRIQGGVRFHVITPEGTKTLDWKDSY
jgi:hypothetical protein